MPKKPMKFQAGVDLFAEPAPRRPRGRPPGPGKPGQRKRPQKAKENQNVSPQFNNILNNNNMRFIDNIEEPEVIDKIDQVLSTINLFGQMTEREGKFLEYNLIQGKSIKSSLILAGFPIEPDSTMYFRGRKILQKLEQNTEDHRKIARAVGAGEVKVIRGLLELAEDKNSGAVARVAAYTTLGKWLGMSKEQLAERKGITIIIEGPRQGERAAIPPPSVGQAPGQPQIPGPVYPPGKAITITE